MPKAPKQPTLKEFLAEFPDDDACMEHLMRTRYGERHDCHSCGKNGRFYRVKKRKAFECEHCGYQVYPMAGTPFEKTRTSLHSWFFAMFLFCASRNGVSAKEIQRQVGVTYKTAWRMARLIREYMTAVDGDPRIGGEGKIVEADKSFIGGHDKIGEDDKTIVLGMVERDGDIATRVLSNRREATVCGAVADRVRRGSWIATDDATAFRPLWRHGFLHSAVNHSKKEYVRGHIHTNTIEGFWNLFKAAYRGTYIHLSAKHLPSYLGEFEFRWNLRRRAHLMLPVLLTAFSRPERRTPSPSTSGQIAA